RSFYNLIRPFGTFSATCYIAIGIRRQIKVDKQSISFARLLKELAETPSILSRKYYTGLYKNEGLKSLDFDQFCTKEEGNHISPKMVEADLEKLKRIASNVEGFADKRVAHHDRKPPKILPTFNEVDDCLKVLDELYVKYHLIFHAESMASLMPTYQYDWKEIFEVPWIDSKE
ncbi:MAG: hypothetical protein ACE5G9_10160, partial [Nitrospinales bacterium]